jgi:peptidoglycan hydrolase-like protein with peptidoglycan-binding domain
MSRSYTVLAASLLGIAGLVAIAQVTMSADEPSGDPVAAAGVVAAAEPVLAPAPSTTAPPSSVAPPAGTDCSLSMRLAVGMRDPEVTCLEAHLVDAGVLRGATPDAEFDAATEAAVEAFQTANSLVVDGVVGPQTATLLGAWTGPDVLPADPATCAEEGRSAVVDRFNQRAWLCEDGEITDEMPITSAVSQPDPGTYEVYAKDLDASSTLTGEYSTMTHFVAFTYGKYQGARIAFHSVPTYSNGEYVQPLDSVGSPQQYGDSSGCIRVLPDDAVLIWDWLDVGDTVTVVS